MTALDSLKYDANGLIPAVVQAEDDGAVLMVGYMNRQAVEKTLETGKVTFWSRSRQKFWTKGESSGHFLHLRDLFVDCDQDCLLVTASPVGPACHEGYRSCFFRRVTSDGTATETVGTQEKTPEEIYGAAEKAGAK
jgi:phosphoribosyl-AMP cyclohydrolase